jgi:hypothetical protein
VGHHTWCRRPWCDAMDNDNAMSDVYTHILSYIVALEIYTDMTYWRVRSGDPAVTHHASFCGAVNL